VVLTVLNNFLRQPCLVYTGVNSTLEVSWCTAMCYIDPCFTVSFIALILLVSWQGGYPACEYCCNNPKGSLLGSKCGNLFQVWKSRL